MEDFSGFYSSLALCSILISGLEENMKLELIKFVEYVKVVLGGEAWRRNGSCTASSELFG